MIRPNGGPSHSTDLTRILALTTLEYLYLFTLRPVELQRQVRAKTMEHTELRSGLGRCEISTESRDNHNRSMQPTCPTTIPDREAFTSRRLNINPESETWGPRLKSRIDTGRDEIIINYLGRSIAWLIGLGSV